MENNDFYNDILSIEQMIELESLGMDTSDSSCHWTSIQDKDHNPVSWLPVFRGEDRITIDMLRFKFPLTYKEGNIYYCYTLTDVLNKIKDMGYSYVLCYSDKHISMTVNNEDDVPYMVEGNSEIEVVFEVLKKILSND